MALPWAAVTTVPIWYFTSIIKHVLSTDSPQERNESQITLPIFLFLTPEYSFVFLLRTSQCVSTFVAGCCRAEIITCRQTERQTAPSRSSCAWSSGPHPSSPSSSWSPPALLAETPRAAAPWLCLGCTVRLEKRCASEDTSCADVAGWRAAAASVGEN